MSFASLSRRDTESRELMDEPDCDPDRLGRTYRQFTTVNRLVSGWRRIYRERIRPQLSPDVATTVLDIGFGGGDIPRSLARWAARDGLALAVTAIDPDERAILHIRGLPAADVHFEQATSADVVASGERFDIVISNHLLHHLQESELRSLLDDSLALSRRLVIHNDLARGRLGYHLYAAATVALSRGSFVHQDGLLSIRRSYRPAELRAQAPPGWQVQPMFPQRLLLTHDRVER